MRIPERVSVLLVSLVATCSLLATVPGYADELLDFTTATLDEFKSRFDGEPFLLTLWSVDCPPCRVDLENISAKLQVDADLPVVLVAADPPAKRAEAIEVLEDYSLDEYVTWIFADNFFERLRFSIDPNWFGELPRSYFYDEEHQATGHSGIVTEEMLGDFFAE
ncbi:MAG: hypothetical protein WDZ76_09035 [Pseudohongiellaceae bacterium]